MQRPSTFAWFSRYPKSSNFHDLRVVTEGAGNPSRKRPIKAAQRVRPCFVTEPVGRMRSAGPSPHEPWMEDASSARTRRPEAICKPAYDPRRVVTAPRSGRVCNALGKARPGALNVLGLTDGRGPSRHMKFFENATPVFGAARPRPKRRSPKRATPPPMAWSTPAGSGYPRNRH